MPYVDQIDYHEALTGIAAGAFCILFAIYYLQRSVRRLRRHGSIANLAQLLLALAGLWLGLAFLSNSVALAWLLDWTGPYELIPPPYDTLLDIGFRAGEIGALVFGGIGALLWVYAWRLHLAQNRRNMKR